MSIQKDDRGVCKVILANKKINENGEEELEFMKVLVKFRKGVEVKNKAKIDIKDGFLTFFRVQEEDGKRDFPKLMVMDFDTLEEGIDEPYVYKPKEVKQTKQDDDWGWDTNDDLPF